MEEESPAKVIFGNENLRAKLVIKLPKIFKIAEIELSRGNKLGMEVGVLRERIIVSFLMYALGKDKVSVDLPPNFPEADCHIKGYPVPISIKTKTGKGFNGIKLKWTVDWKKVKEFYEDYSPSTDLIFVQVVWGGKGIFAYIPLSVQEKVFKILGRERYIKLPKKGTNPRGVEISSEALRMCVNETPYKLNIKWVVDENFNYDPFERWIELWEKDD